MWQGQDICSHHPERVKCEAIRVKPSYNGDPGHWRCQECGMSDEGKPQAVSRASTREDLLGFQPCWILHQGTTWHRCWTWR
jgi:hypothetical protein